MGTGNGGWESVVGELDDPEPELDRTPVDLVAPPFAAEAARPLLDLKSGERAPASPPTSDRPVLSLPKPAASSGPVAPEVPKLPPLVQGFSGELMDRLAADTPPAPTKEPFFVEYKELLSAIALALALIGGFVVYKLLSADDVEVIAPPVNQARTPGKLDPAPAPKKDEPPAKALVEANPQIKEAPEPPPPPPAQPMLSVMTVPSEATIEVNGLVRGKSPMVIKSPSGNTPLRMKITKNRYKTWEEVVAPNEAGHFVVKVALEER